MADAATCTRAISILTPPMCWHGHINESDHRIIWFDAANIPLIRSLDANFFEPGDPNSNQFWQVDEGDEKLWAESGIVGAGLTRLRPTHSPKYRYSGAATRRLLDALPVGSRRRAHGALHQSCNRRSRDAGSRLLRHAAFRRVELLGQSARPATSSAWSCPERAARPSANTTFHWSQHDVFSIPHWNLASHTAIDGDADLFIVSDKVAFERLDLLREEYQ